MREMSLGLAITVRRELMGFSLRELSDKAGISYSFLASICNGSRQNISFNKINSIAHALEFPNGIALIQWMMALETFMKGGEQ
jgi:transcriptional regulator with XRE-family HTH domain